MSAPDPVDAVVDHEAATVTVAVTFAWDRDRLVLDHGEGRAFVVDMQRAVVAWLTSPDGWGAPSGPVTRVGLACFEPDEERNLGMLPDLMAPLCIACGQVMRPLDEEPWYEHVELTACPGGEDEAGHLVRFANLLDVDLAAAGVVA